MWEEYVINVSDHGRMKHCDHIVMQKAQAVASFDAHYGLQAVCGNCVSLGQIRVTGEIYV